MNRPSLSARVAASVPGAIVMFLVCAALVSGWYQGQFPWWLALGAMFGALHTIDAIQRVRRYRAWRTQWNAMGGDAPVKKRGGTLTKVAATIAVLALLAMAGARDDANIQSDQALMVGLPVMFGASSLYLLASLALVLVRPRRQAARRRSEAQKEKARAEAEAAPVTWLLPPSGSSPSREEATRNLPEYAAKLLRS
jgi:hypothetical protein